MSAGLFVDMLVGLLIAGAICALVALVAFVAHLIKQAITDGR